MSDTTCSILVDPNDKDAIQKLWITWCKEKQKTISDGLIINIDQYLPEGPGETIKGNAIVDISLNCVPQQFLEVLKENNICFKKRD
ncbi:MAG: hypothetical protein ACXWFX_16130 [Methylobacter sp.]